MAEPIVVSAIWDAANKVWVAESKDVPGLATGADTLEELIEKLKTAIPEMLAENGIAFEPDDLPFRVEAERSEYASVAGRNSSVFRNEIGPNRRFDLIVHQRFDRPAPSAPRPSYPPRARLL